MVLNALGGLYLAYELLGAKRGPLRLLSRVFTYSAIFGLGYAAMLGLWFGLSGAFVLGRHDRISTLTTRTRDSAHDDGVGGDGDAAGIVVWSRRMAFRRL